MTPGEAYEALLVPSVFRPWADAVLTRHPPAVGGRVLDVACGTGIAARLAAGVVGPRGVVLGIDLDDGMLAAACAAGGRAIVWLRGDATALPVRSAAVDYVICLEGLQFFPDRGAGLAEMRRVLRPGGRLVATVWGTLDDNPAYAALADGLRTFVSEEAARLPPFSLTATDDIGRLVTSVGFTDISVTSGVLELRVDSADAFVDGVAAGGPTVRRNLAQLPTARRMDFGRLVAERLARYRTTGGLALPSRRTIVTASRGAG